MYLGNEKYHPMYADEASYERGTCGCESWTQGGEFVVRPCRLDCPRYLDLIEETRAAGNAVRFKAE